MKVRQDVLLKYWFTGFSCQWWLLTDQITLLLEIGQSLLLEKVFHTGQNLWHHILYEFLWDTTCCPLFDMLVEIWNWTSKNSSKNRKEGTVILYLSGIHRYHRPCLPLLLLWESLTKGEFPLSKGCWETKRNPKEIDQKTYNVMIKHHHKGHRSNLAELFLGR